MPESLPRPCSSLRREGLLTARLEYLPLSPRAYAAGGLNLDHEEASALIRFWQLSETAPRQLAELLLPEDPIGPATISLLGRYALHRAHAQTFMALGEVVLSEAAEKLADQIYHRLPVSLRWRTPASPRAGSRIHGSGH